MPELEPAEVIELWADAAFESWNDEDPGIFEKIKTEQPSTYAIVKHAFQVGFAMGAGAAFSETHEELLIALKDLS